MAIYMIGYDLHPVQGETYGELIEAIKKLGAWWHCLDSTWLVISNLTAVQIRDTLWGHMRTDDQLLVMLFNKGSATAWAGFNKECADWLKNNV